MDTENKDLINNIPEGEKGEELISTLDIDNEDISSELERYGITEREETFESEEKTFYETSASQKKKSFIIQTPVIIAAVSFLLVAVIVLGSVFIFNKIQEKKAKDARSLVVGTWSITMFGEGVYLTFDNDGNAFVDNGVVRYIGKYEMTEKEISNTASGESNKETEPAIKSGVVGELFNEFYGQQLMMYGMNIDFAETEFIVETSEEDPNALAIIYADYGLPLELTKSELPKRTIDASVVTHASADELGITELNIDDEIVGTWFDGEYNYFTFNSDGTAMMYIPEEDVKEQSGYSYRFEQRFTYTVYEDKILLTVTPYVGDKSDGEMPYSMDNGKLILGSLGYTRVE